MAEWWLSSGVLPDTTTNLLLPFGDSTGMQVKVPTGKAWVKGHFYENDAVKTLAIAANATGANRLDQVILRADFAANTIEAVILQGTGVKAALTQTASVWELPLALVTVPNGATTITAANVTDLRQWADPTGEEVWTGSALPTTGNYEGRRVWATGLTSAVFRDKQYVYRGGLWRLAEAFTLAQEDTGGGNFSVAAATETAFFGSVVTLTPIPCAVRVGLIYTITAFGQSSTPTALVKGYRNTGAGLTLLREAKVEFSIAGLDQQVILTIVPENYTTVGGTLVFEGRVRAEVAAITIYNTAVTRPGLQGIVCSPVTG